VGPESHRLVEAIGRLVMNFERDQRNLQSVQQEAFGPPPGKSQNLYRRRPRGVHAHWNDEIQVTDLGWLGDHNETVSCRGFMNFP